MNKENCVNKLLVTIQTAVILDVNANVMDKTKALIKRELEALWDSAEAEGEVKGLNRADEIIKEQFAKQS